MFITPCGTFEESWLVERGVWVQVIGSGVGWIVGAVAAPALLLRLFGVRVDGARLLVGIGSGAVVSGVLFWLLEMMRFGYTPSVWPTRAVMVLSSSATFAAMVLAARERHEPTAG